MTPLPPRNILAPCLDILDIGFQLRRRLKIRWGIGASEEGKRRMTCANLCNRKVKFRRNCTGCFSGRCRKLWCTTGFAGVLCADCW
eukprot:3701512-Rhodomonas_salina.3